RPLTGLDPPVRAWVLGQDTAQEFVERVDDLLAFLLPAYLKEAKAYLTIAVGCTGGQHRSVVLADEIARLIEARGYRPTVQHRDVDR
ncbi:MAG: RNase adaptor protein RapZ, partial [Actinobacteria bacterium]|nr:RNase adaptor protein RapZ [Actinomycetota bacterium]